MKYRVECINTEVNLDKVATMPPQMAYTYLKIESVSDFSVSVNDHHNEHGGFCTYGIYFAYVNLKLLPYNGTKFADKIISLVKKYHMNNYINKL